MGYSKQANTWMPTDRTKAGDISVSELQAKLAADQKAASDWATSTWSEENTLTMAEVNILDGKGNPKRDSIGSPVDIASGNKPAGYKSGTYQPTNQEG